MAIGCAVDDGRFWAWTHGVSICDERLGAQLSFPDMEQPALSQQVSGPGSPALLPIALS